MVSFIEVYGVCPRLGAGVYLKIGCSVSTHSQSGQSQSMCSIKSRKELIDFIVLFYLA